MTKAQIEAELFKTRNALRAACAILSGEETIPDAQLDYTGRKLRTFYLSEAFLRDLVAPNGSDIEYRCTAEGCQTPEDA